MEILFRVLICIMIIVVLYLLAIMPRMIGRPDRSPFLAVLYAHRGLHDNAMDAPENSMAAFQKAVEAGYGIELDVQLSKEKIPVVFHDFTLKRVCGVEGKVSDFTYEELQKFRLFQSNEKIPTLAEVLHLVQGKVPLIVEYKIAGMDPEVCVRAEELFQHYEGLYCIESFHPTGLFWYRRNRKHIMRGQLSNSYAKEGETGYPFLMYEVLHHLLLNFLTKPDFIAYNHKYHKDMSRVLCRYLYRSVAVAWTIQTQVDLDARQGDFDLFIFDSFLPREKQSENE